ncbi:MAG: hypothetical protein OEZ19_06635 [Paracoccaceae bacterium]|nr:hypothetical protein [Paracoccaceae bacterium]
MIIVETSLLYVATPSLYLSHFADALNIRLGTLGLRFESAASDSSHVAAFIADDLQLVIKLKAEPLSADNFQGAFDTALSRPYMGLLSDSVLRHSACVSVTVVGPEHRMIDEATIAATKLRAMQVAHMATVQIFDYAVPSAVYWHNTNQLVTAPQYMELANDTSPWALFTRGEELPPGDSGRRDLQLRGAEELVGRPVVYRQSVNAAAEDLAGMHAASLSFLHHAVETGAPIPHGHSFGIGGEERVVVSHVPATDGLPNGSYELRSATPHAEPVSVFAGAPILQVKTRAELVDAEEKLAVAFGNRVVERNTPLSWRTGMIAISAMVIAAFLGGKTVLTSQELQATAFYENAPIEVQSLDN